MAYCPDCGTEVSSRDTYCSECGTELSADTPSPDHTIEPEEQETIHPSLETNSERSSGTGRETAFYIGAVLATVGVIFVPFVFVFVALPEAILQYFNKSIQNSLPQDARNNAAVSGSFLIFRWFGNFLILLLVLGVIVGILLAI